MSHHEAKYLASFLVTLPITVAYALHVRGVAMAGGLTSPDAGTAAGRSILILIGSIVGVGIAVQIVLHVGRSILGQEVEWREDERDRLIELKSINLAFSVFGAGFLGAIIGLALGWPPALVLHLITGAMLTCGLVGDLSRLWRYRRGV